MRGNAKTRIKNSRESTDGTNGIFNASVEPNGRAKLVMDPLVSKFTHICTAAITQCKDLMNIVKLPGLSACHNTTALPMSIPSESSFL